MQIISRYSLSVKLIIGVALIVAAYIICLTPGVTHAQTSAFAGAEIVILNQTTPFHVEPASSVVRFVVAGGTLAEVLYFADPEIRDGQIWRKLRVADGYYGYVRESLISKYTGTIPSIWLGLNYQASQVHLNYEARKGNYNIVINQGVNYVTPPEGVTGGSSSDDTTEEEEVEEEEEETTEEVDSDFEGRDIVVASRNASFHTSPGGDQKFVVARGTIAEILYFSTPQEADGEVWHKLRVADGNWGYVTEDSIDPYTGTVPTIWREINYQPSKVHLNYEARKGNPNIVINQGVVYVSAPDNADEEEEVEEEEETIDGDDLDDALDNNAYNRELLLQIIKLLTQLLNLRLQNM